MADYEIPEKLRYTADDEWVRAEDDRVVVGVTDFAQQQLGDVVYVELPEIGAEITRGGAFGVIESVKAVSDLIAPITGSVVAMNAGLADRPEAVNEDCYGEGWMIAVSPSDASEVDALFGAEAYLESVRERA